MSKQQFISGVFKIHNPSRKRRQVLNHVFVEYTQAMSDLLDWSKDNLETIKDKGLYRLIDKETGEIKVEKFTDKSIARVLPRPSELKADMASCLKESLVKNVSAMLSSYLELDSGDKQEAGFPLCRDPSTQAWPNALSELCLVGNDLEAENEAIAKMMKLSRSNVMPVYFSRSRDFAILVDIDNDRFFLWTKLLANDSTLAEKINITQGNLVDINTDKTFTYRGKTSIMFPLEIGIRNGDWHWQYEKFIKPVMDGHAFIKSGRLIKHEDDYFFHVSIGFDVPDVYEPETYLGIDRGVLHSVAYGLIDKNGAIIEMGHSDDPIREIRNRAGRRIQDKQRRGRGISRKDYKQKELDGILHRLVNEIIDIALDHRAMIVMEDLNLRTTGRFYKSAYQKIFRFLEYKCKWYGVPIYQRKNEHGQKKPGVWAAYSSKICIHCGEEVERDDRAVFCPACGKQEHSDDAAGINIARRALYRAKDWGGGNGKPGDWRAFHRSFANGH